LSLFHSTYPGHVIHVTFRRATSPDPRPARDLPGGLM